MNKEKKKEVVDNSYRCYSWWAQKLASTSLGEPVAVSGLDSQKPEGRGALEMGLLSQHAVS